MTIKTHQVESGGVRGKFKPLPGEISRVRAREKSAKAIVAERLRESGEEPRAEESTNWRNNLEKEPRELRKERGAATAATTPPKAEKEKRCSRSDPLGAKFEAILLREVPESKFEDSTAVCGKPHVRWCGRGGGRNPATSTRSKRFAASFTRSVLECCGPPQLLLYRPLAECTMPFSEYFMITEIAF